MPDAVLVIDDNPGFLRVLREILGRGEPTFDVTGVTTARDGLALLRDGSLRPAFVVLDFHLPDLNAPAVLDVLRTLPGAADLPVLVLTQADWRFDETTALAAGATRFGVKPSRITALRELIVGFWHECVPA